MTLDRVMHVRTSSHELREFESVAKMLGITTSELLRILMRADKQVISRVAAQALPAGEKQAVIYLAIDDEVSDLAHQIKRYGLLLNQATRALNDLRKRRGLAANFVVEKLIPIDEKLTLITQGFDVLESAWDRLDQEIQSNSWAKVKGGTF